MARTVYCVKLKKQATGLAAPPLPGEKGQWLFDNVSQPAWHEWQSHQTRLINEKHLNLLNPNDRQYLMAQMERYFAGESVDQAAGYRPEAQ